MAQRGKFVNPARGNSQSPVKDGGLSGLADRWRSKQQNRATEIATENANATARYESELITKLEEANFQKSALSKETLATRSYSPKCCDLDFISRALVCYISDHPLSGTSDMSWLYEDLIIFADKFKNAVRDGHETAAVCAQAALSQGIMNLRSTIPSPEANNLDRFISIHKNRLHSWQVLIDTAISADIAEKNAEKLNRSYTDVDSEKKTFDKSMLRRVQSDNAFINLMAKMKSLPKMEWDEEMHEENRKLVDRRNMDVNALYYFTLMTSEESKAALMRKNVDILKASLESEPDTGNPELLDDIEDETEAILRGIAEADTLIETMVGKLKDFENQLETLVNAPGAKAMQQLSEEGVERSLNSAKRIQEELTNTVNDTSGVNFMKQYNIKSLEEENALIEKAQQQMLERQQELLQYNEQIEEEMIPNYN